MRVLLEIGRSDGQFGGSVVRLGDRLRVEFVGVLELVAALERLEAGDGVGPDGPGQEAVADDDPAERDTDGSER